MLSLSRVAAIVADSVFRTAAPLRAGVSCLTLVLVVMSGRLVGQDVVLELVDGRILSGHVDERTDDAELWLHSAEPSILVLTSVPWTDVSSARVGKETWSAAAFRGIAQDLKAPVPAAVVRKPPQNHERARTEPGPPRVQSLDVITRLANWDRDAEPDGIEVRLAPLAADGTPQSVEGIASVRLLGRRIVSNSRLESRSNLGFWSGRAALLEHRTDGNTQPYVEVGRWNERLRKSDLSRDGEYVIRLPFRNIHPEYDLDVALNGQIDVKLSVTGQNVFYATAPVELRAFSPLREELQLNSQTRFFPDEFRGQ